MTDRNEPWSGVVPVWALIAAAGSVALSFYIYTGFGFIAKQLIGAAIFCMIMLALSVAYRSRDERISRLARAGVELFLLCFLCGGISYAAITLNRPLWDDTFLAWDRAIGFHWQDWLSTLNEVPIVHQILRAAYFSLLPQWCLVVIVLCGVRAYRSLDLFLLSFGLAALITVLIAAYMPALSPIIHLGILPADHPNISLAVDRSFADQILAIRNGTMTALDLQRAGGLVTFPSFHTVGAVLLMAAFWHVRGWRWFGLAANTIMLIGIPIEGSHYLVDVFAGAGVALAALWASAACLRWWDRRESGTRPLLEAAVA